MALTVAIKLQMEPQTKQTPPQIFTVAENAFDASYPTGGEAVTPGDYGMTHRVESIIAFGAKGGYEFDFDRDNQKLKAMYYDYAAAGAGAAIEVPNATDLSAVKPLCLVIGW